MLGRDEAIDAAIDQAIDTAIDEAIDEAINEAITMAARTNEFRDKWWLADFFNGSSGNRVGDHRI